MLTARCSPEQLMQLKVGRRELPFYRELTSDQQQEFSKASLPLPSARQKSLSPELQGWIDEVLAPEGLEMEQLRIRHPKDCFFSKGVRKMVIQPEKLEVTPANDEMYPDKQKLTCRFVLPRGSYATMLVKRLTTVAGADLSSEFNDDQEGEADLGHTEPGQAAAEGTN